DAAEQIDPVTGQAADDNPGLVLDRDLQEVVNTLWQVGAEAIAINGQRLTSVSTIRAAGGVVLVDFKPITSPYRVSAIGSSDLASAFEGSRTATRFRSYRQTYRMGFSVRSNSRLTLPAASEPQLRYAHPPSSPPSNPPSTQPASPAPASLSPSGPPAPSGSG
ncbi:MAG: DUF881 domain-containing protein, partial [Micromonosporaceae bacterium]|nr:DUF881 domain-containing protein [Micromonosporaceae bacterium]